MLRLVSLGLATKQVAVDTKIGVSTRSAAALYAIEHGILAMDA